MLPLKPMGSSSAATKACGEQQCCHKNLWGAAAACCDQISELVEEWVQALEEGPGFRGVARL